MSKLEQVMATLEQLALLGEIKGENPFKTRAYSNAVRHLKRLPKPFDQLVATGEIKNVEGIGKGILEIIDHVMHDREVPALVELLQEIPPGLLDILNLPGVGPKKVKALWQELGITSVGELAYACQENRLVALQGFGPKTQEAIQKAIIELGEKKGFTLPDLEAEERALVKSGRASPKLVTRAHLLGAFHNHTLLSDGSNSIEEMREAAIALGLTYLGISDHSQSAFYANGLKTDELLAQKLKLLELNRDDGGKRCHLFSGVESDILADGSLDYPNDVLAQLDVVVASVHSRLKQNPEQMTARMINAALNPFTTIVGHPTGRLVQGRKPSEYDMDAFLDACQKSGCAVELNANPHRLDLNEVHLAMAKERGIKVAINADAHSTLGLNDLDYGIMVARKAGLTPEDVINCLTLDEIFAWLKERHIKANKTSKN
jgi:histidinol phosphatase-like PHP family hydrolase